MGRLISKVAFNDHAQWIELAVRAGFQADHLAQQIGLSRRQVERYVKRHFGLTPQQWLRELRMARAGELIRVMHSVKEVAYALGFSQVPTFCRQFKAHYGVTCSEYAAALAQHRSPPSGNDPRVAPFPQPVVPAVPLDPPRVAAAVG